MKKQLPIGVHNFSKIITDGYYYVDKTLLIKDFINDGSMVVLLPRPRRFGKTLNMNMLWHFFDIQHTEENRKLFDGLLIAKEAVFELHQGKYPVIFISFKDVKSNNYEDAFSKIAKIIKDEFKKHEYLSNSPLINSILKNEYDAIVQDSTTLMSFEESLKTLCQLLFTYHNVNPIILIDEYDTPIHSAYLNKYYEPMINFMRAFLGASLKDNPFLHKGLLTGTLRISKESIFTGFNNPSVYSVLRSEYSRFFGFTPEELHTMLEYYEITAMEAEVRRWYNGYIFGKQEIYNPWSILGFVHSEDKFFRPHWVNTSSNDLIKELIIDSPASVRTEMEDLLKNIPLVKTLDENISFPELKQTSDNVFSFLVFSGYLKARFLKYEDDQLWYELTIPNIEVKHLFESIIVKWFKEIFQESKSKDLLQALLSKDIELFEELLNECIIETLSVHDVQKRELERVYQAFILGLLVTLTPEYEVTSNKESGYGRYDICIVPLKSKKPSIIMELKSIRVSETAQKALDSALLQIETKQYETTIKQRGYDDILKLAIVFDGKRVWVKTPQ